MPNPTDYGYGHLCECLMKTPFTAVLPEDVLRAEEALYLRRQFVREAEGLDNAGKRAFYMELGPVSLLEIMVVLIERMSYEMIGLPLASNDPLSLFLELCDNCGFGYLNDRAFKMDEHGFRLELDRIAHVINEREYSETGEGGFFPLETGSESVTNLGLLQQMEEYLVERYNLLE